LLLVERSQSGGLINVRRRTRARILRALRQIFPRARHAPRPSLPSEDRWVTGVYRSTFGQLAYRLYVPRGYRGQPVPLVVLLHGCRQTPEDFAVGTRMNALAERDTFLALYPAQSKAANRDRCWNWFEARHQRRGSGEPALVAGLTRRIMRRYAVDSARTYVAGMSAGAALAVILAATYPDLYAAAGIHSGLPYAAVDGPLSAWQAMRGYATGPLDRANSAVPLILFHGAADTTVDVSNARHIVAQWASEVVEPTAAGVKGTPQPGSHLIASGHIADGHAYTRSMYHSTDGVDIEEWVVHGLGHRWSGGDPAGSFTDPNGPAASEEMLRFFASHDARSRKAIQPSTQPHHSTGQ
jgi:poly(hydroxyalkanoate) depolymerase family esterase